jgi:hypothetical protein
MQVAPIITFRGARRTTAMVADITDRALALDRYHPRIMACRILVEFSESRHEAGNRYHVRIDLTVPGGEIIVAEQPNTRHDLRSLEKVKTTKGDEAAADEKYLRTALQHAFSVARRRLQSFATRQRGEVKTKAQAARRRA